MHFTVHKNKIQETNFNYNIGVFSTTKNYKRHTVDITVCLLGEKFRRNSEYLDIRNFLPKFFFWRFQITFTKNTSLCFSLRRLIWL